MSSRESSLFEGEVEERKKEGGRWHEGEIAAIFFSLFFFILGIMKTSVEFVPEIL
jgi:hypothetical protein